MSGVPAAPIVERRGSTRRRARASSTRSASPSTRGTETCRAQQPGAATGNVGRRRGVNPLRGQNNVQGACDMGALPNVYRLSGGGRPGGAREVRRGLGRRAAATRRAHPPWIRRDDRRARCAASSWSARTPWCRTRLSRTSRGRWGARLPGRAGHLPQRDGGARRRRPAGTSFAEKDGTFTNTERQVQRVRGAVAARRGARRLGYPRARSPTRLRRSNGLHLPTRSWTR